MSNGALDRQFHELDDAGSFSSASQTDSPQLLQEQNDSGITSPKHASSTLSATSAAYQSEMSTIDNKSSQPPSPDHFPQENEFNTFQCYDSDTSDGSIVVSFNPNALVGAPLSNEQDSPQRLKAHERFPSFDSLQSTGSFQIIPNQNKPRLPNNNLLPYDQRRLKRDHPNSMDHQNQMPVHPLQINPGPPQIQTQQHNMHFPQPLYVTQPPAVPSRQTPPRGFQVNTISSVAAAPRPGQLPPLSRPRLSSADSGTGPPRPQRVQRQRTPPTEHPPPPPPPQTNQQYHVRTDSSGSVSSLGSTGSKGPGFFFTDRFSGAIQGVLQSPSFDGSELDDPRRHSSIVLSSSERQPSTEFIDQHTHSDPGGTVFGIFHWPADSQTRPVTVEEFHRRNQFFLQSPEGDRDRSMYQSQQASHQQMRRPVPSDTPRNTRGQHQPGIHSVDNDIWDEQGAAHVGVQEKQPQGLVFRQNPHQLFLHDAGSGEASSNSLLSSSESELSFQDEHTSLLPPSGISSHEHRSHRYTEEPEPRRGLRRSGDPLLEHREDTTTRRDNRIHDQVMVTRSAATKSKKKSRKHRRRARRNSWEGASDENSSSDSSPVDYRDWSKKGARMLARERTKLIDQWKAEARAETERVRKEVEMNRWYRRLSRSLEAHMKILLMHVMNFLGFVVIFISNLPITIGAVALAIVTLGVVWFKFAEENMDSCQPVHFHSSQCTFPEFPGCFFCDTSAHMYKVAVLFHFMCSAIAGVMAMTFVLKCVLATRVVLDEMSSPTTSSPAGLICMTIVCVFAGQGWIGQVLVSSAAAVHLCLAIWFIYVALAYHIMPDPSWFPNTVGIGLSAVKIWLYYPMTGHLLMAISLSLNFFFFPISLIRVTLNRKISAPVCWIQMSAPAVSLYALTIMAQPSFEEEHPDINKFQRVHRLVYLPCMHFLFGLACIGVFSSFQSLAVRWNDFKKREFSPAHAAFCFPTLAHTNAIQAYRAAVNTFSDLPPGSPFKVGLYTYWVIMLCFGTIATLGVTAKFIYMLPSWTLIDTTNEEEPPAPYETSLNLQRIITTGETLRQPFVSPAILQANETGALIVRSRDYCPGRFVRTRRLTALGFDPIMNWSEMNRERDVLLDWVGKNPPRRRAQTLSVPGIDFNYGYGDFGNGHSCVYEDVMERGHPRLIPFEAQRSRAATTSGQFQAIGELISPPG